MINSPRLGPKARLTRPALARTLEMSLLLSDMHPLRHGNIVLNNCGRIARSLFLTVVPWGPVRRGTRSHESPQQLRVRMRISILQGNVVVSPRVGSDRRSSWEINARCRPVRGSACLWAARQQPARQMAREFALSEFTLEMIRKFRKAGRVTDKQAFTSAHRVECLLWIRFTLAIGVAVGASTKHSVITGLASVA